MHAMMERSLHHRLLGGNFKTRLEKLHCRPGKQDEAAAKLGYGLRSFDTGQACPLLLSLFGSVCGSFECDHCCALGSLRVDKAMCENGSRCLAVKRMLERVCYFGRGWNLVLTCLSDVHVFRARMGCLLDGCMSSWVVS
jgi:hypothetical protein